MKLNNENYYSKKADMEFLSVSQYKMFYGAMGHSGCEAHAMAKLKGEWQDETSTAMLVGSYVDAFYDGTPEEFKEFKENNPIIFKKDGTLKAEYVKAEEIIQRIEADELFKTHLSGEKQVIMTGDLFGAKWKIKMDSYFEDKLIVDLKVVKDIHERFWIKDYGYTNFIEYWGYDLQLAIYQKIVEINTGKKLPCVIACIDKTKTSNLALVQIPQMLMDNCLDNIETNVKRILDLKAGKVEPIRCEKCDYCKATKKLKEYTSLDRLIEV